MEQTAWTMGSVTPLEPARSRGKSNPLLLTLNVSDPEVLAELGRRDGDERHRFALAALRIGILALRTASGQIDAVSVREAGNALIAEVRELLSGRVVEMNERLSAAFGQYLDPQSGALPQRLEALVRSDGELDRLLRSHVGSDDSVLARSLAAHLGEASPLFKMLSPTEATGLRAQVASTIERALEDQRQLILREFSLDRKDSALSRLVGEFSMDDEASAMSRLSRMLSATSDQIEKSLTLDDDTSPLSRLKRELFAAVERLVKDSGEFQSQVREALAKLDTRRREDARAPRHGVDFEEHVGALLAHEAQRLGDLYEATGDTTGLIKNCKIGDYVVELGSDSAAAHARVVWEAKDKGGCSLRAALEEIGEARRNRQAQVGAFVFSRRTAPEGLESLHRHGSDILLAWDPDDPASDVVIRAAYSLARALAVRERRDDRESLAALAEIERAARSVEKQITYLEDVRKWAETVKGHGEKIVDRSARMVEELWKDVELLDAHVAATRRRDPPP